MATPEMQLDDSRSSAAHDCDRILYSDALRRLGGVTQVVAVGEQSLFHTRLTHTLKVAQLSRRLAEHLNGTGGFSDAVDVDAAEAAGLAHDLGHPPFGHIGEKALDVKCQGCGLDGYEGNAQSIRIVAKLSVRGTRPPLEDGTSSVTAEESLGLNLSSTTLRAIMKYPWLRDANDSKKSKKWNIYPTEVDAFSAARKGVDVKAGPSIEAAIMDWADDITYAVHDFEDFFRAGRIPLGRLLATRSEGEGSEWQIFCEAAGARLDRRGISATDARRAFESMIDFSYGPLRYYNGTRQDQLELSAWSRWMINRYVSAAKRTSSIDEPLGVPEGARNEIEMLKQLTWHYVIEDSALASLQAGQTKIIDGLFDHFTKQLNDAEDAADKHRLPVRLLDLWQLTKIEPGMENYPSTEAKRARAVADYISSLTESQAINLYERINGTAQHSVLDPWLAY